jgi:hypothetical protein
MRAQDFSLERLAELKFPNAEKLSHNLLVAKLPGILLLRPVCRLAVPAMHPQILVKIIR